MYVVQLIEKKNGAYTLVKYNKELLSIFSCKSIYFLTIQTNPKKKDAWVWTGGTAGISWGPAKNLYPCYFLSMSYFSSRPLFLHLANGKKILIFASSRPLCKSDTVCRRQTQEKVRQCSVLSSGS